jgi:translocation and assembly module TamA
MSCAAFAADPQGYEVELAGTGNGGLDSDLRATSDLVSLRKSAPVGPFGLIARARGEVDRLKTVLESFGYYQASVNISIDGLGLNNPGLGDAVNSLPKAKDAHVAVSFTLGPLYHLGKVSIEGAVPPSAASAFTLKSGAPAVASDVLAAGAHLQSVLQAEGYAFASVDTPVAYEDAKQPLLDVTFKVSAGAKVNIGHILLEGLGRVHETVARRRLTVHSGEVYNPAKIEAARRDLLTLGPFAAVSVEVGKAVDDTGGVPLTFVMHEKKRHQISLNAAYSSDLGGSGGATWTDRNVFGNAEQLSVTATAINFGGSDTTGVGYDLNAKLTLPDFGHRDQTLQFAVGALKENLPAYDQKAVNEGVTLNRKLSSIWSVSAGVTAEREQINQDATLRNYTLVALPLTATYDSTDLSTPLDDPTHGMRDSLSVAPTQSLGSTNATFIITKAQLASYFDLSSFGIGESGRNVFAVRAVAGRAVGVGNIFSLPPDQRLYAGGSGTVRGYAYQDVGPQFTTAELNAGRPVIDPKTGQPYEVPTGIPIGGTSLIAGSLEFRKRFGLSWGGVIFADAGQVTNTASLRVAPGDLRIGVGIGARYYSSIGPIRVDFGVPMQSNYGNGAFQVYVGLGQAF